MTIAIGLIAASWFVIGVAVVLNVLNWSEMRRIDKRLTELEDGPK